MKTLPIILLLIFALVGCGQNQSHMENASSNFYTNNEDKFGFLVFDKQKVDTFFKRYLPLKDNKEQLDSSFKKMLLAETTLETVNVRLSKYTHSPNNSDYQLAKNVLTATIEKEGEKYLGSSLNYLFFFESLPDEFQNKMATNKLGRL